MKSFPLRRGIQPREPAWKRAKNQGCSRREGALGNSASAVVNRQTRKKRKQKGGRRWGQGKRRAKKKKREKKKNRKSVGKRNYRLMRRSFHHVASEREDAIDRCFTTEVIRVFARPLFPKTRSFRHDTPGLESSSVGNCSAETPATDVVEIR